MLSACGTYKGLHTHTPACKFEMHNLHSTTHHQLLAMGWQQRGEWNDKEDEMTKRIKWQRGLYDKEETEKTEDEITKTRMKWRRGEWNDKEENEMTKRRMIWQRGNKRTEKTKVWQTGWWNNKGADRAEEIDCERQLTSWARITISPVCRISVDFPPMFGPVTMTTWLPACLSPISSESWLHASIHTHTHTQKHTEEYTHTHKHTQ